MRTHRPPHRTVWLGAVLERSLPYVTRATSRSLTISSNGRLLATGVFCGTFLCSILSVIFVLKASDHVHPMSHVTTSPVHPCSPAIEVISASSCRTTTTSLLLLIGMNASGGAIMSRGHHHTTACALTWRSSSPDSRAWHRHVCTCTKLADPQAAGRAGPRCILTSVVYTYLRRWSSPSSYIGTWWWPARAGPFTAATLGRQCSGQCWQCRT